MANIVKKEANLMEWDPVRVMREMMRWDPFREMMPAFPAVAAGREAAFWPAFDVTENKDAYLFKADLPGIKQEDLEITHTGNRLQIAGKRDVEHEEKTDTVYTYERQYGNFCRTFTLPEGADVEHARTELKDGVLTLAIPKKPAAQARKIAITAGAKS